MAIETGSVPELLKAKYTIPGINRRIIPRLLLNEKLAPALSHKLTLITAPAGYGKTTAVLKWLQEISVPSAWLSLDSGNNDPRLFWKYFCAALESISDGITKAADYVFASPELFAANMHLNILLDRLSGLNSAFVFVLDDLHLITNQEILDSLSFFISYLPSNMHLVLISRTEPHMKLTKLGLKEDLLRLRSGDLRFNALEIRQYFKARGYSLQEENIQSIETYTEGWAAALAAVALSFQDAEYRSKIINSLEVCDQHLERYLADDVMSTWTEEQWRFMEATSVCERLCYPLCEAIAGDNGGRLLKELEEQNSFLIALDESHVWFRFHHLFLAFLRKRLKKEKSANTQDLHKRAGDWFAANNYCEQAVEHYLQGTYYEAAVALMEKLFFPMIFRGAYARGISWLRRLPESYKDRSPAAMFFEMYYYASIDDFQNALKFVQKVEHFMKANTPVSDMLQLQYILAKLNLFFRQSDAASVLQLLTHLPTITAVNKTVNYVDFNLYDISCYRTQLQIFITLYKDNPENFYFLTGNFSALFSSTAGYIPLVVGEFNYESGNSSEALPHLTAAVDEAVKAGCLGALVPAMVTLAKIRHARGDFQGAVGIVEECENRADLLGKFHWGYLLTAFKVRLNLDMGNLAMADKWIAERRLGVFQEITAAREYELIVLSRVYLLKQRYNDAALLLNRLLTFAEAKKRVHSAVEIHILLAETAMNEMNDASAEAYFEKALSIGLREGYVSSFTDELAPMVYLLERYAGKHQSGRLAAYAKKLLRMTRGRLRSFRLSSCPEAEEHLTPAEQKVLRLIKNARSNQEIADELAVTVSTVKAHTGSIYKKLGVRNRAQCMNKVLSGG